ncbi:glycosyltransferase family 4 protein [Chryseolinea sp. H1M3-3]|uniref:glycosyltransferase family 4 protein n=1 Tax=Chryseolinea sp. H1M3-3 TaxID=3034144 RepID=UPI0023EE1CAC|nr:glycosyltransferase family 4 protein [Chryseolinea sp. H1M3-3]
MNSADKRMSKPSILIIENSIAITGALKSIIRSSQGLADNFNFIFILPKQSRALSFVREQGFDAYELPMKELRKNFVSLIGYGPSLFYNSFALYQITKRLKVDLLVVNDFYNLIATGYKILGGRAPYICYVRFLPSKFPKQLVKFWCALHHRYAMATVAVSEAVRKELPYQEKVVVIGNELPAEEVALSSTLNCNTILYPANYIQGKGHEFALESFARVSRSHSQWNLRFVGGDMGLQKNKDFKKYLMALANRLNLEDQVSFHDFSNNISNEYLHAGIVLNFSESESFSMTCLEAMYYGRPVVATRSGGPSEIIDQNETGILVNLKDIDAMANAIDYLIKNPERRQLMASKAYESVRQKFSFSNTIGKLEKLYQTAVKDY